jgi:hypothetical protein
MFYSFLSFTFRLPAIQNGKVENLAHSHENNRYISEAKKGSGAADMSVVAAADPELSSGSCFCFLVLFANTFFLFWFYLDVQSQKKPPNHV